MITLKRIFTVACAVAICTGAHATNDSNTRTQTGFAGEAEKTDAVTYTNPVIKATSADPSCIKGDDGYFYVFTTGGNVRIWKSRNLVNWEDAGTAFTDETRPNFIMNDDGSRPGIWAPDLNRIGDKYVMYYALHTDRDTPPKSAVGVAVADSPAGPYKDLGKLLQWDEAPYAFNDGKARRGCIDPEFISADGRNYLFVGSFRGIFAFELTADGLALKNGAETERIQIAGKAYEGTYIYKRGKYYYMLLSMGKTIPREQATYRVAVGRSENPLGPYVETNGIDLMTDPSGYILLDTNDKYIGPGHNGEIITDNEGNDWLLYHAYTTAPKDRGRHLCIDKVTWTEDGWPVMNDGKGPTAGGVGPVF